MTASESFAAYWWYHIPNLALAALIYTLIGRYLLEILFAKKQDAVILTVFRQVTDPIVNLVRLVTPGVVPQGLTVVFAMFWMMAARLLWFLTAVAYGMRLT
ncbi:MAG: hypothetical protein AB7E80_04195 [Hyphomicrobiaceae bacterium]